MVRAEHEGTAHGLTFPGYALDLIAAARTNAGMAPLHLPADLRDLTTEPFSPLGVTLRRYEDGSLSASATAVPSIDPTSPIAGGLPRPVGARRRETRPGAASSGEPTTTPPTDGRASKGPSSTPANRLGRFLRGPRPDDRGNGKGLPPLGG